MVTETHPTIQQRKENLFDLLLTKAVSRLVSVQGNKL